MILRDYQLRATADLREVFRTGARSAILYSPTGSGKTVMACDVVSRAVAKSSRVLFLGDSTEIVDQTSAALDKWGVTHGICCGPIAMTELEYSRLFGKPPQERLGQFPIACGPGGDCPMVSPVTGQCSAYERRPLICRLFGVAPGMVCPHVKPGRMLTDAEATDMIAEAERISTAAEAIKP